MGFLSQLAGGILPGAGSTIDRLTGEKGAEEARRAAALQAEFGEQASGLLDPFQAIGQQGLDQAGLLTDPQAQFEALQSNPLFQAAQAQNQAVTGQAQDDLFKFAASRGRLSAGDTIQQTQRLGEQSANNLLLSASPLIQQQKQSIGDLLNFGQNTALAQGNLLTQQGNVLAGGIIGAENAKAAGLNNILNVGAQVAGSFSDPALKSDIKLVGEQNNHNIYTWHWNEKANELGLFGTSRGVMANEVKLKNPEAITNEKGFMKVNYSAIGVKH